MTINVRDKTTARLLGSAFALVLAASPLSLTLDRDGAHLGSHAAFAKDGGNGGSGGSGSDHDSDGGDHSGPGGGGGDDGGGNRGNDDGPNHDANDDNGQGGAEHVGSGGTKVEINGNDIEVVHASGIKEAIENGRFEMKDASGRTIVERRATAADIARLASFAQ